MVDRWLQPAKFHVRFVKGKSKRQRQGQKQLSCLSRKKKMHMKPINEDDEMLAPLLEP